MKSVKKDGEIRMTQQNNKSQTTTLQNEGQALTTAFKKQTTAFKKSITEGFDFRLGTLIKQIKEAEGVSTLSNKIRKKYKIDAIDRRRTSEAEWLIDNSQTVADFVKKTKFSGTSIPSLQNAMRKHYKDTLPSKEEIDKESAKADNPKTVSKETAKVDAKASKVSNIGQADTKVENFGKFETKSLLTASDLAFEMLVQAEKNSIPTKELLLALKEQIELLSTEGVA
tara:strand:- start:84 stop:761 length:678 start_codon:yes stop_codon:yes gene_type:complete